MELGWLLAPEPLCNVHAELDGIFSPVLVQPSGYNVSEALLSNADEGSEQPPKD